MKNQAIIYGIIGLIVGAALTGAAMSMSPKDESDSMSAGTAPMGHGSSMSMEDMMKSLDGKSGDEFDKAFISAMVEHHQGAIDMAEDAQASAKHEELKAMASGIISAQETEISQMKQWQKDWGYEQ